MTAAAPKRRPWATAADPSGYVGSRKPANPASKLRKPVKTDPPEWRLQAEMVAEFHKLADDGWQLAVAGDMGAAKRSFAERAKCKAMGLTAGEPDVRVYCHGGATVLIEVKTRSGDLNEAQRERHILLRRLGFVVYVEHLTDALQARATARQIAKLHSFRRLL